jgi:hypothetical protein
MGDPDDRVRAAPGARMDMHDGDPVRVGGVRRHDRLPGAIRNGEWDPAHGRLVGNSRREGGWLAIDRRRRRRLR